MTVAACQDIARLTAIKPTRVHVCEACVKMGRKLGSPPHLPELRCDAAAILHRTGMQADTHTASPIPSSRRPNRGSDGCTAILTTSTPSTDRCKSLLHHRSLPAATAGSRTGTGEEAARGRRNSRHRREDQPADLAHVNQLKEDYFALAETDSAILAAGRAALRRIEDGTYGRCVVDGEPIDEKRLEAVPWTAYCLEHQTSWMGAPALGHLRCSLLVDHVVDLEVVESQVVSGHRRC